MIYPLQKSAFARLYFPELAPHQACNRLRRWIVRCKQLHEELLQCGYSPSQRVFTPRQVRLIVHYLGEPGQLAIDNFL
ncbi:DUF4248 domain-containing protein [Parabacteroides gordonii]|uniref:DUF4248 domain-containing protein n=1 Tax=Parabacteroides gordonii TaxID=574930 RepID=UPI0026EFE80C|nr:DUF4248 domain-containing protein [Parabacteroides gordonii]